MASLLQSSMGLLRSRLSQRIVTWVFASIILIEAVIFVPSFYRRRGEKLRILEERSADVLITLKANVMAGTVDKDDVFAEALSFLDGNSIILGITLYHIDGTLLETWGEAPELSGLEAEAAGTTLRQLQAGGSRYDVAWPSQWFEGEYILVVRHDATSVHQEMVQYVLAIAIIVIIISAFVTLTTILVLERILIVPVLYMRDDLKRAGEAVGREEFPHFLTSSTQRDDELGEVAQAFREMYQRVWQEISDRRQAEIALKQEQEKSERLLRNILPPMIADQLKDNSQAIASRFEAVTILFADIVDFTGLAAEVSPRYLVNLLNDIFSAFDCVGDRLNLEKIKTIGDAYMVVGGAPQPRPDHAEAILVMAIEMQRIIQHFHRRDGSPFRLRIGIHTGPVIAGVIGIKKFSYDLWGDTVNIASRMESHGVMDRIQVSATTYAHLQDKYDFEDRGCIHIKGRGEMHTYLYLQPRLPAPTPASALGITYR